MSLEFITAKRRTEPIPFTLDGEEYSFTPPKTSSMVFSVLDGEDEIKALFEWLDDGLSEEQATRIEERLRDPKDDLDINTLAEIVKALLEKVNGRPTKQLSAFTRRR